MERDGLVKWKVYKKNYDWDNNLLARNKLAIICFYSYIFTVQVYTHTHTHIQLLLLLNCVSNLLQFRLTVLRIVFMYYCNIEITVAIQIKLFVK